MVAQTVATTPFEGQKPGTSGLRKKTKVFMQPNYVENFVQATFNAVGPDTLKGSVLVVGGDGRYYNDVMIQTIVKMSAANGVSRVVVGKDGLLSTPAVSCLIRRYDGGIPVGGFILTASHNPGGLENDCGIKYNVANGGPAPESITSVIYSQTTTIDKYLIDSQLPPVDIGKLGSVELSPGFCVEIVDCTEHYVALMKEVFDFDLLQTLTKRTDFSFIYDAMHGVAGPYAKAVFCDALGVDPSKLLNCSPSPNFNNGHPDPNLTYAPELVKRMGLDSKGDVLPGTGERIPDLGAAADGDADRNMILGKQFFVTPSDSLAIIAAYADRCIPFFAAGGGLKALARSMPTSAAVDIVAEKLGKKVFQVPTGWKFFGNLMDSKDVYNQTDYNPLICGEESFGTGSNHVREKDGIWAVLCWLSIIAFKSKDQAKVASVESVVRDHWRTYGRNYYCRYDYEEVDSAKAATFFDNITKQVETFSGEVELAPGYVLASCDIFEYTDPVDASVSKNQGWRFLLKGGSRFVFRKSGTGSSGATIRLYLEKYESEECMLGQSREEALGQLVRHALAFSKLQELTGRDAPTVIT